MGEQDSIRAVVNNATVPVIETGTGNCHIYVDETADLSMAVDIIENAKTQRIGVCNACESLVIHKDVAEKVLPMIKDEIICPQCRDPRGCQSKEYLPGYCYGNMMRIGERNIWITRSPSRSYRILIRRSIISTQYNTGHSEAIITQDYNHARKFLNEIDAACVYVNASTRFTDGFEFGFGAEIGISTQKLHARGPMGLEALTSTKYIIYGNGQIRP